MQFDVVHHQIWVSRDDCDQKNGMFLHRNEKLRSPVIREMSGQTPRGTFNRLEFWNAVPPGHLMKNLRQIANLQHTGTGFIGNAYLLRFYGPIKVALHTNLGRGLTNRAFLISALSTPSGALSTLSYSLRGFGCRRFLVRGFSCHWTITVD